MVKASWKCMSSHSLKLAGYRRRIDLDGLGKAEEDITSHVWKCHAAGQSKSKGLT